MDVSPGLPPNKMEGCAEGTQLDTTTLYKDNDYTTKSWLTKPVKVFPNFLFCLVFEIF